MPAAASYPWYSQVEGSDLEQGDIFVDFPVLISELSSDDMEKLVNQEIKGVEPETEVKLQTVITMTQSCDLANNKTDTVMLCPVFSLDYYDPTIGISKLNNIRKGEIIANHMLNRCDVSDMKISVVEFTRIYMTSKKALAVFASGQKSRIRLNPPYREHLSQSFARYFMRVGLPADIPKFTNEPS